MVDLCCLWKGGGCERTRRNPSPLPTGLSVVKIFWSAGSAMSIIVPPRVLYYFYYCYYYYYYHYYYYYYYYYYYLAYLLPILSECI